MTETERQAVHAIRLVALYWSMVLGNPTGGRQYLGIADRIARGATTDELRAMAGYERELVTSWARAQEGSLEQFADAYKPLVRDGHYTRAAGLVVSAIESVLAERARSAAGSPAKLRVSRGN